MHAQAGNEVSTTTYTGARLPCGLSCASTSPALLLSKFCTVPTELATAASVLQHLGTTIAVRKCAVQCS